MSNNFVEAMRSGTMTENGGFAWSDPSNDLVKLFGLVGALRNRDEKEIENLFASAWRVDPLTALKICFYARDIRNGGLGERDVPRVLYRWLAFTAPNTMIENFSNVEKFGRFDDFYTFCDTPIEKEMWAYLKTRILLDLENSTQGKPVSLAAKWLKSANTSSAESRALGRRTAYAFGIKEKQYRKMLSYLRRYIDVVETKISDNDWENIDFETLPSRAILKYRKAFSKHCGDLFNAYLEKVRTGEKKINTATLYPYDLVKPYVKSYYGERKEDNLSDAVIEESWKKLPDYVKSENNILVMADTSGSMTVDDFRPLATSTSLAIYFAERNKGAFANCYMTFNRDPDFITIDANTSLKAKIREACHCSGYNTDLDRAFRRILDRCVMAIVPQEDIPKALIIISDMEIDSYARRTGEDFVKKWERKFKGHGYTMPKLIFWNVEARHNIFLGKNLEKVQYFSGSSAATFGDIIRAIDLNAYEAMMFTLSKPAYNSIILSEKDKKTWLFDLI